MHHYDKFVHSPGEHFASADPLSGATLRMLAAMAEPDMTRPDGYSFSAYAQECRESDRAYFRRRSEEEQAAASAASVAEAREAHREISVLYARLAGAPATRWQRPRATHTTRFRLAAAARAERQDALLDSGLIETFPASDPVSVVMVD